MPIYAYRCTTCGHAKDVLRKMSDPLLTQCPACGASTFVKQVTAAGFKLKGTGWYVTDFRDHGTAASKDGSAHEPGAHIDVPHIPPATHAAEAGSTSTGSEGGGGANGGASKSHASNGDAAKGGASKSSQAAASASAAAPASAPASGASPGNK
ncbi:MAG: FmdB family zinc ribbon protein [Burkholderiaceae bacterium]